MDRLFAILKWMHLIGNDGGARFFFPFSAVYCFSPLFLLVNCSRKAPLYNIRESDAGADSTGPSESGTSGPSLRFIGGTNQK
jgi:hypothetical protein